MPGHNDLSWPLSGNLLGAPALDHRFYRSMNGHETPDLTTLHLGRNRHGVEEKVFHDEWGVAYPISR